MKKGFARELYGVISTTSFTVEQNLAKLLTKHDEVLIGVVDSLSDALPDSDIVIFSDFISFMNCSRKIHSEMIVIVCAGPIQLVSLENCTALDYTRKISYEFTIIAPNYKEVVKQVLSNKKKNKPVSLKTVNKNHLSMIADSTVTASPLINGLNKVVAVSNHNARLELRKKLSGFILGKVKSKEIEALCESFFNDEGIYLELIKGLRPKNSKNICKTIILFREKGMDKANKICKDKGVDLFEARYLYKMVKEFYPLEESK